MENQLTVNVRVYFWALNSTSLIYMSILNQPHCFDYCNFIVNLEIKSVSPPTLFFFKIVLVIWVSYIST